MNILNEISATTNALTPTELNFVDYLKKTFTQTGSRYFHGIRPDLVDIDEETTDFDFFTQTDSPDIKLAIEYASISDIYVTKTDVYGMDEATYDVLFFGETKKIQLVIKHKDWYLPYVLTQQNMSVEEYVKYGWKKHTPKGHVSEYWATCMKCHKMVIEKETKYPKD